MSKPIVAEQTYSGGFKIAIIGHLKKKKNKPYSGNLKSAVIGLQHEQTYRSGFKTIVISHLKYKKILK